MTNHTDNSSCTLTCWAIAALAGIAVMAMLMVIGDWRLVPAFFIAAILALVLGAVLARFICTASTAQRDLEAVRSGAKSTQAAAPTVAASPSRDSAPVGLMDAGATDAAAKTAEPARGPEAAKVDTVSKQPAKAAASEAPTDTPKRAAVAADGKPATLSAPRGGGADDLKRITGVGPKLEGTLNDLGFWHFDQIAAWRKKEIEWVDSRLKFKGRIERDNWVDQAKALAKGGDSATSKGKKT
jgi:predicted flap endonuclease-1-like 5' DNA nuclease